MTAPRLGIGGLLTRRTRRTRLAALVPLLLGSLLLGTTMAFAAALTVTSSDITIGQDITGAYVTLTPATGIVPGGTVTLTAHGLRTGTTNVTITCSTTCTPSASRYSVSGGTLTTTATFTIAGSTAPGIYSVTASDSTSPAQAPAAQFAVT